MYRKIVLASVGVLLALAGLGEVIPIRAVAHRGLWDDTVAENTVEAIRRAYAAGAECVETDFHEESDGRMMCYHDRGRVAKVKEKHADYRMPTLEEVLAVVPKDREIQAEIKTYGPGYAEKFTKAVAAAGLSPQNVTVSSFDSAALKDFKSRHPEFCALWLVDFKKTPKSCEQLIAEARAAKFDVVCPGCVSSTGVLTPADADAIKAAGLDFRVYGVNTPSQFRHAIHLGATGFTSDRYLESREWAAAKMPRRGFCAHRGDRATCPENTVIAMKKAIARGAEMVEFDLQRCKTGEIVVLHDSTVDRTTNGKGRVAEMTYDELRGLDAGVRAGEAFRGEKIPTLDEMLAVIPRGGVWINLHCYDAEGRCIAEEVALKLREQGRLHQGVLAAPEPAVALARAAVPDVIACDMSRPGGWSPGPWTSERTRAYIDSAAASGCEFIQFIRALSAADIAYAHKRGLTVCYFESDDPVLSARLFADGVDFVLTNDIDMNRRGVAAQDKLVFADGFDGPLDTNVWRRIGEGKSDWNRHMSKRPDLVEMRDGCLVLVGKENTDTNDDPRPFLTGGVWNRQGPERTMMTYGLVEIRAKFEDATGAWPAFWMLPKERESQGRSWPWGGEIDIIERLNGDPFLYHTAHSVWTVKKERKNAPKQGGRAPFRAGQFNVYGLERTPTALVWYINGEETFRYEKTDCGDADQWPFTTPFYFLLDMQLGGEWVGEVDVKTLPVRTWIDWIHVYSGLPESPAPRKFVAAEQKSGAIAAYYDRPGRVPQLQWAWSAKDDPNVRKEDKRLFGVPDECKPSADGKRILMNDSLGGFAGLDVMTGLCTFYGNAGGNPHSIELLPDGNVAVASSTGRTLKIFNVREHPFEPSKQNPVTALDLPGGHGVAWDAARGTLFALGYTNLYELAYAPETMSVKVLHCWDYTKPCNDAWGHDLIPDGKGGYLFTNHAAVWRFDPKTGVFAKARSVENVKSISLSPDGDLMAIPRERWWTDTLLVYPSGSSDHEKAREITLPGAKFYKARWLRDGPVARAESEGPILPGWGKYFWNQKSIVYQRPPAFDFTNVAQAVAYRFDILNDRHDLISFAAARPTESLASVWTNLADNGFVTVFCHGVDASGRDCGMAGPRRTFWKKPAFDPAKCAPGVRPYAEAALLQYEFVFSLPHVRKMVETGALDYSYEHNCYPTKMNACLIGSALHYAELKPSERERALRIARAAADCLIDLAEPEGAPLAGFTPTYAKGSTLHTAGRYAGQNMLLYPATAGQAFTLLYQAVKDAKYLTAARRIADTYLRLQGEDGTWHLKLWMKDGSPVNPNRLMPFNVCDFLWSLAAVTGEERYRAAADRAFAYVERGPLENWNWEGQFEDVPPSEPYQNLTKHPACEAALMILKRFPNDRRRLAQARALLEFAEDQFVFWERPCRTDGTAVHHRQLERMAPKWPVLPVALEQYSWYVPVNASLAKVIRTYLALYAAERNPLDLAKAKALGDACTRAQCECGCIPSEWMGPIDKTIAHTTWINCQLATAEALELLARVEREAK